MAQTLLDLTVKSGGEFLRQSPPLRTAVITYDFSPDEITIAWERSVNDIVLNKEQAKELIKCLINFI